MSPWPALAAVVLAIATAALLSRAFPRPAAVGRFVAIDGLRGYLAFAVYLSHGAVWYVYLHDGRWQLPASRLYVHFGQSSVALFFMITGFLFFSKLLDGRRRPVDWTHLYLSRVLRLAPIYLCAMAMLMATVGLLSAWQLHEPASAVVRECLRWLVFCMQGMPDINGVRHTPLLIAWVTWSLPYEWLLYLCLPLLALPLGQRPPAWALLLAATALAWAFNWGPDPIHLMSFAGGIAAAFAVRWPPLLQFAEGRLASCFALACLCATVALFPSAYRPAALLLLTAAFALIAAGCTLFGVLGLPVSRVLGDMSYSLYLLHGLALFGVFELLLGHARSAALTPAAHWAVVVSFTPLLVGTGFACFRLVEAPALRQSQPLAAWLSRRFRKSASA